MKLNSAQECSNCKFWEENEHDSNYGKCLKSPPTYIPQYIDFTLSAYGKHSPTVKQYTVENTSIKWGDWPETFHDQWCGAWEQGKESFSSIDSI
jgi:NAD-dependent oxidoreductase involved in siderophore biosynthesis